MHAPVETQESNAIGTSGYQSFAGIILWAGLKRILCAIREYDILFDVTSPTLKRALDDFCDRIYDITFKTL